MKISTLSMGFSTLPFRTLLQPDRAVLEGFNVQPAPGNARSGVIDGLAAPHPVRGARSAFSVGRRSTRFSPVLARVFRSAMPHEGRQSLDRGA